MQAAFLAAFEVGGNLTESAEAAGVTRAAHYWWLSDESANKDDYAKAFEIAEQKSIDALEREARKRALEGWEEPVFFKGMQVAVVIKKSDRMLELLLQGKRPDVYSKRKYELTGKDGAPLVPAPQITGLPADHDALIDRCLAANMPLEEFPAHLRDKARAKMQQLDSEAPPAPIMPPSAHHATEGTKTTKPKRKAKARARRRR